MLGAVGSGGNYFFRLCCLQSVQLSLNLYRTWKASILLVSKDVLFTNDDVSVICKSVTVLVFLLV